MSDNVRTFEVACVPGPMAAAGRAQLSNDVPVLVIYLDPVKVTVQAAPTRAGWRELAEFCRRLADESSRLAAAIDPDRDPVPPGSTRPRHALTRNESGDSGAGH